MIDGSVSKNKTKLGTPCSKKWNTEWIELVDKCEAELGHRCCGAHAPDGLPCEVISDHTNGRCRFHGGTIGIGAPEGNTNARIHGLYSRRLQTCGTHCPMWETCPMAGKDIAEMAAAKRPLCPYEQAEHDSLTALEEEAKPAKRLLYADVFPGDPHPLLPELSSLRENLKTLQIMITRAAGAMKVGLTQDMSVRGKDYSMDSSKPSAALQAYQMLSREHRQTTTLYKGIIKDFGLPKRFGIREETENMEDVIGYEAPTLSSIADGSRRDGHEEALIRKFAPWALD